LLFFSGLLLFSGGIVTAQESEFARRFQTGAQFYGLSRWQEAAVEFRRAQEAAENKNDWTRALYWVILSQMAFSDFGSAIKDMEELERAAPNSTYTRDMIYHRARFYHHQGFFEEALILFNQFNASTGDTDRQMADRRAASFFWMGECLFAMGQFDEAEKFYAWVIGRYPDSPKLEAASYRIDLIRQKKIELELLALLQWSHEESLRTSEEHQRTLRTYEHTLNLYQRRIAELSNVNIITEKDKEPSLSDIVIPARPPEILSDDLQERAMQLEQFIQEILRENESRGIW